MTNELKPQVTQKRLNDLYKCHTVACWAKGRLKILGDMAEDNKLPQWYIDQVRKIGDGILVVGDEE